MAVTSAEMTQSVGRGAERWWHWHLDVDDATGVATLTCSLTDADPTDPAAAPNPLVPGPGESGGVDVTLKNNQQRHVDFIANGWVNAGPVTQNLPVKRNASGRGAWLSLEPFYTPPTG